MAHLPQVESKLIPLPLGDKANLSLSLGERLGEGLSSNCRSDYHIIPLTPASPSRERGSFHRRSTPSPHLSLEGEG